MTNTTATLTTTSVVLDGDTYVAKGSLAITSYTAFAETFRALGGVETGIRPGWALGTDEPVMAIVGTPEAVAYVESLLV